VVTNAVSPKTIDSAWRTGPRTLGRMFFSPDQGFAASLPSPSARLWEWCIAVDVHNLRPDVQEPAGLRIPGHRVGGPNSLSCVPMVITALSARERQLNQAPNCFPARRSRLKCSSARRTAKTVVVALEDTKTTKHSRRLSSRITTIETCGGMRAGVACIAVVAHGHHQIDRLNARTKSLQYLK
jgi:hypothetical protein